MRPDIAAFRELDTLVRNLTDQLAGYRRRALSAEARTRELEEQIVDLNAAAAQAQKDIAAANEAREHALAAAREATSSARAVREALEHVQAEAATQEAAMNEVFPNAGGLVKENEQLRSRLTDARERTTQLVDRVRFLRQQIGQGVEK